ncbi:MAG: pantoate--beta-alanine ligase [Candidatus Hydrogenedentes bacterium]|jgi:pantoate--beta-alanine ligase|nr:pantoate--beta-alanine ligase [Candidatus Hydrogenedentota bacterium]
MMQWRDPRAMRAWSETQRCAGRSIGFVPTMGALHAGHLSLVEAAAAQNDCAVASIFVNPTQFAPHEDFDAYPRSLEDDLRQLETYGVQAVYLPTAAVMYPEDYATFVEVNQVSEGLCGASRPHFFRGVATVVTKLFNAVQPHRAYFGQKDAQQCAVIKRMVRDLDMGIEIKEMPIVREADGLAMSSRNAYLSAADRSNALCLSRALFDAEERLRRGERSVEVLIDAVKAAMAPVNMEYVMLVDADTMGPVEQIARPILLAVAAQLPTARLIDNIKFDPTETAV